jgi:hypothetical protein
MKRFHLLLFFGPNYDGKPGKTLYIKRFLSVEKAKEVENAL